MALERHLIEGLGPPMSHRLVRTGNRLLSQMGRPLLSVLATLALVLLAAMLFATVGRGAFGGGRPFSRSLPPPAAVQLAVPNLLKPVTPEEAVKENNERQFSTTPDSPAQPFHLRADQKSRERAIECLTQAIYYESAAESAAGKLAVAQVVLNRVHHPGFPSTICGVVYQGSDLPTGCQFSFTCDGSLARIPVAAIWEEARRIAAAALNGRVSAVVGHATHYHADYVLPYWADSLAKQVQIGHHIFYRLKGTLGFRSAFSQRYAGKEFDLPTAVSTAAVAAQAADLAEALINANPSDAAPLAAGGAVAAQMSHETATQVLVADKANGGLLIDQGIASARSPGSGRHRDDCSTDSRKQILPAAPNDLHLGASGNPC